MNTDILIVYTVVSFFYVLSPGPAVFLAIANGMTTNMKTVMISSFANILGLFLLSSISILGVGALLLGSAILFSIVKAIGAAYLIYLGIKQLMQARRYSIATSLEQKPDILKRSYFKESFLLAATNPKPILFFVALFPQFLDTNASIAPQFFLLTAIFMTQSFVILCAYGAIARFAKNWLGRGAVMRWFHRITGGLFIMMGLSLLKLKNHQAV